MMKENESTADPNTAGGAIDSRLANTVGYLATGILKAFQQGDIEGRLRAVETVLSGDKTPSKRRE